MRQEQRAIATVVLAVAGCAWATVFRVGPAQSYASLPDVVSLLGPGDTVLVDGDHVYTGGVTFTQAGLPSSPVVVRGVRINGNRPVLSGGTNTVYFSTPDPSGTGADHYIFEGFEVTGGSSRGIFHQADDLTVRDVLVRDCPQHGILGADQGSGDCLLEFVEVRNCGSGDSRHQIYMATDEVNRPGSVFRMQYCYLHDGNGGNNVKSRAERNEIYFNWIEGAYFHELELIGPDPGGVADGWTEGMARENADVVGNVLCKRATNAGNNVNFSVTRLGGDGTGQSNGRYRFVNNTVIAGTGAVFRCFDGLQSITAHNNVFYCQSGAVNMMRTVEAVWTEGSAVLAGSNNWVKQGAANVPTEWTGTVTGTDPGFEAIGANNLVPASGSDLLNAGTGTFPGPAGFEVPNPLVSVGFVPPMHAVATAAAARPVNGTLDIGAYELAAATVLRRVPVAGGPTAGIGGRWGGAEFDLTGRQFPATDIRGLLPNRRAVP